MLLLLLWIFSRTQQVLCDIYVDLINESVPMNYCVMCHARRLYRRSSIHFFPEATNRQIFSSLPLNHFYSLKIRENVFLLFVRVAVRPVVIVDAISRLAASRVVQGLLNFGQGNTRRKEEEKKNVY